MQKFAEKLLFFGIALLLLLMVVKLPVSSLSIGAVGQDAAGQASKLQEIRQKIVETELALKDTRQKKATLQNEIAYQEGQIKLTELKIEETKEEIDALGVQIDRLEVTLVNLSDAFQARALESYRLRRVSDTLSPVFTSKNISEFISRLGYLKRAQQNDRKILRELQETQVTFEDQKKIAEELEARLESQKRDLAMQKDRKVGLLEVTRNDEKKYQDLLQALRADEESIRRALSNIGAKVGDVKKGDVIATVGNTGCSTGPHLHFEVWENAKVEDGRVVGSRINPHDRLGQFQQPLPDSIITADYGISYLFGTHTGIDFAYKYNDRTTAGQPIYAAENGVAYLAQDSQACWITGTAGKGVVIDHENGLLTLYWHIP